MVLLDQTTELRKITCLFICIHRVPQLSHSRSISRLMHVLLSQTVHSLDISAHLQTIPVEQCYIFGQVNRRLNLILLS
jgi:hypothetical protein